MSQQVEFHTYSNKREGYCEMCTWCNTSNSVLLQLCSRIWIKNNITKNQCSTHRHVVTEIIHFSLQAECTILGGVMCVRKKSTKKSDGTVQHTSLISARLVTDAEWMVWELPWRDQEEKRKFLRMSSFRSPKQNKSWMLWIQRGWGLSWKSRSAMPRRVVRRV